MQKFGCLIVGIIFIGVAVFMYFKNSNLVKNCTVDAIATVVDMREDFTADSDGSGYMYYPIIEYQAGENKVEVEMSTGSSTPAYRINEKINILYNPNKTDEFIIKGDSTSNIISIVFGVLGLGLFAYGIVIVLKK